MAGIERKYPNTEYGSALVLTGGEVPYFLLSPSSTSHLQ